MILSACFCYVFISFFVLNIICGNTLPIFRQIFLEASCRRSWYARKPPDYSTQPLSSTSFFFSLHSKRLHCRVWRVLRYIEQVRGLPAAGGVAFSFSLLCCLRVLRSSYLRPFHFLLQNLLYRNTIQWKLILQINKTFAREYISDYRYDAATRLYEEWKSIYYTIL